MATWMGNGLEMSRADSDSIIRGATPSDAKSTVPSGTVVETDDTDFSRWSFAPEWGHADEREWGDLDRREEATPPTLVDRPSVGTGCPLRSMHLATGSDLRTMDRYDDASQRFNGRLVDAMVLPPRYRTRIRAVADRPASVSAQARTSITNSPLG